MSESKATSNDERTTTNSDTNDKTLEEKITETTPIEVPVLTKKDPRRVEQGKRLAMISKQAKERKMREKIEKEQNSSWTSYTTTYFFPIVATLSSFSFFYLYFSTRSSEKKVDTRQEPEPEMKRAVRQEESPKKFESLG